MLRNLRIRYLNIIINTNKHKLKIKFNNTARKNTLAASLSLLGKMIASSYLKEEIIFYLLMKPFGTIHYMAFFTN